MEPRDTAAPETTAPQAEEQTAIATADPAAQPEQETSAPATPTEPTADGQETGQEKVDSAKETGPKSRAQKRIDKLTASNYQKDEEIRRLAARAAEAEKELAALKPPKEDDFQDHEEFQEARINHAVSRSVLEQTRKSAMQEAQKLGEAEKAERGRNFVAAVEEFKTQAPDFDTVVNKANIPLSGEMTEVLTTSDKGPQMLYHLSQNPDLAAQIAQMPPQMAYRTLGRIEAQIESAPPPMAKTKPITKAPPPVTPLPSGGSPVAPDYSKMSAKAYMDRRIQEMRRRA